MKLSKKKKKIACMHIRIVFEIKRTKAQNLFLLLGTKKKKKKIQLSQILKSIKTRE